MSYPPIMVRQWPFDGYSRQPVGTPSASRGIRAQFRPGYAGLVDNSSLSQGTAIQASAYRAALASANEEQPRAEEAAGHSQCGIKAKREPVEISASRGRRRRVVPFWLTGGRHQARSAILHKEPSHPGAFRRYGSRRLGSARPLLLERCHSVVKL